MSFALPPTVNNKRRGGGGTPGSSNSKRRNENHEPTTTATTEQQQQQQQLGQVPVEFEISLRLRPLVKKERDDHIVLEVVPPDCSTQQQETAATGPQSNISGSGTTSLLLPTSVALHPIPRPDLTPSSALILQTLSPETIQTCHDVEFRFDHVFGTDACQDAHVYPTLGRPMAHSVMEPLMNMQGGGDATAAIRKTHLVIAMGGQGSGKTYTCWGGASQISKRKTSMDGLVPRMVDSLFGQFLRISSQQKHQQQQRKAATRSLPSSSSSFAVNLSILQVNQSKNPKHSSSSSCNNNDGCKVHDLFQPVVSKAIPSALLSPKVQSLVATFERSRSGNGGSQNSARNHRSNSNNKTLNNSRSPSSSNLDALVRVHQDPVTHEFHVMNGHVRICKSAERARDSLQEAFQNSRKRTSKRHQSHVLVQIQPVLLDRLTGRVICEGGTIVVLDMAGNDDDVGGFNSNKTRLRAGSKRNKDSLPNRNDAHSAVLHCLRSIQFNEQVRRAGHGSSPKSTTTHNNYDSMSMSDLSCPSQEKSSLLLNRNASFKQVPYRQHVLTMLLQPCFSPCKTDQTQVSILLAASPGHRDYREKKAILTEIESFWTAKAPPAKQVMTGCLPTTTKPMVNPLSAKPSPARNKKPRCDHPLHSASDADDEFESTTAESKSSSTTCTAERPPKNDLFKRSAAHQTLDSLPVKLPSSARKKQRSPPLYPSSDADDEFESSATELKSSSTSSTQHPPPSHDIFKTKCQHSAPGVENTHSMAYSDSSIEDDYYTLPPPIAPPLNMTTLFDTRSSNSCPPQRVMSPDASAPPEEHVKPLVLQAKPLPVVSTSSSSGCRGGGVQVPFLSDFPGVSLPFGRNFEKSSGGIDHYPTGNHLHEQIVTSSLSIASLSYHHSNSSEELQEVECVPLKKPTAMTNDHTASGKDSVSISGGALADESGSSSSLNNTKFSAMKNINKLVHASKKKCERVFEKMSTDLNSINISTKDSNNDNETMVLKERIKELEVQNANLLRENESLRHENEQLRANSTSSTRTPENQWFCEQNNSPDILLQPSPSFEKQQHSASPDKESPSCPHDQRLHGDNDGWIALSPGKPLVSSPGHGRTHHNNNRLLPLSPGKPMTSPESQTSLKENTFSTREAHQYSPVNQPLDGPLALMPGQPLSHDQHSHKQRDRLHFLSDRKPKCKSDKKDEYDSKLLSSSFLRSPSSPLPCSHPYPSDDENVSPPCRGVGICIPTPGEANYILTEDKLKQRSAPTSPTSFGRRDDADPLMKHIANLSSGGHGSTATTSSLWQRESRPGAAVSDTSTSNNNSNLGSFSSNYKSTLYRWQA